MKARNSIEVYASDDWKKLDMKVIFITISICLSYKDLNTVPRRPYEVHRGELLYTMSPCTLIPEEDQDAEFMIIDLGTLLIFVLVPEIMRFQNFIDFLFVSYLHTE